jgi:hypothetical protein
MANPSAPRDDTAARLWDYMVKQQEFSISPFATALIGEGALLFAYASLVTADDFIRVTIALLGIGTGIVLTIHSFISRREALAIQHWFKAKANSNGDAKLLDDALTVIHQWRLTFKRLLPVTGLMTYADGLIVIMWSTILFHVVVGFWRTTPLVGWWASFAIFVIDLVAGIGWWLILQYFEREADQAIVAEPRATAPA